MLSIAKGAVCLGLEKIASSWISLWVEAISCQLVSRVQLHSPCPPPVRPTLSPAFLPSFLLQLLGPFWNMPCSQAVFRRLAMCPGWLWPPGPQAFTTDCWDNRYASPHLSFKPFFFFLLGHSIFFSKIYFTCMSVLSACIYGARLEESIITPL